MPSLTLLVVGSRNAPAVLHGGRVRLAGNPEPRLRVRRSASKRSEGARHRLLPSSQSRTFGKGGVLSDLPSITRHSQLLQVKRSCCRLYCRHVRQQRGYRTLVTLEA